MKAAPVSLKPNLPSNKETLESLVDQGEDYQTSNFGFQHLEEYKDVLVELYSPVHDVRILVEAICNEAVSKAKNRNG